MSYPTHDMEADGMKLRELREDQAYSARDLAERAGIHYRTILRIENSQGGGSVQPRTIRRLAEALGVEPRELRSRKQA
jgi:transcriptional regulator with XRE-family HTH domain